MKGKTCAVIPTKVGGGPPCMCSAKGMLQEHSLDVVLHVCEEGGCHKFCLSHRTWLLKIQADLFNNSKI